MTTELGTSEAADVSTDTPGARLKAARAAAMWSVQQAAEHLHLDPWMIEAMEADRFQALGAPVYARGHLRKYAVALGLPPEPVLARYESLSGRPEEPMPKPRPPIAERKRIRIPIGAIAVAVGVVILGAAAWWWMNRPISAATKVVASEPAKSEPTEATVPEAAVTPPPASAPAQAPASKPAATAPVAAATPSIGTAPVRLRLTFSEPSWIEIEDARGNRLLFDMGQPGEPKVVSGEAPLKVMFGYASAVTLRVNDKPVAVPKRGGGDGARFTIQADGTIKRD
jgi:cytoskeleton protein RodZ